MTGQCYLLFVSAFRLLLWFLLSLFPSSVCLLFFFFLLAWVSSSFLFRFVRLVRGRCNPETRLMVVRWLAWVLLAFFPYSRSLHLFVSFLQSPGFFVLLPWFFRVFSIQDEDNGGKSTRCCWLMDQNLPSFCSSVFLGVLLCSLSQGRLCSAVIEPAAASVVVTAGLLNAP